MIVAYQICAKSPATSMIDGCKIGAKPPATSMIDGCQIGANPPATSMIDGCQIGAKPPATSIIGGCQIGAKPPANSMIDSCQTGAKPSATMQYGWWLPNRRQTTCNHYVNIERSTYICIRVVVHRRYDYTHVPLVSHICVRESGKHWFR